MAVDGGRLQSVPGTQPVESNRTVIVRWAIKIFHLSGSKPHAGSLPQGSPRPLRVIFARQSALRKDEVAVAGIRPMVGRCSSRAKRTPRGDQPMRAPASARVYHS